MDDLTPEEIELLKAARARAAEKSKKEAEKALKKQLKNREIEPEEVQELCRKKYGFYNEDLIFYPHKLNSDGVLESVHLNTQCCTNYQIILQNRAEFDFTIKHSEFQQKTFISYNEEDRLDKELDPNDFVEIKKSFEKILKTAAVKSEVQDAILLEGKDNSFDPLKEYFQSLPEPTTNYLDTWLIDYCGVEDTPINRIIGKKWLLSGVARAMVPGAYIEGCLIFYGGQGGNKSDALRTLNPKREWFTDANVDIKNDQKCAQTYNGFFIIEFAELANISKADLEHLKSFLTNCIFNYVPKYSNLNLSIGRRMIFGGTTNRIDILDDPTGNRRFWVVEVGDNIDIKGLSEIKHDLWAEAYAYYKTHNKRDCPNPGGSPVNHWVLTKPEVEMLAEQNEKFTTHDELRWSLKEYFDSGFIYKISQLELKRVAKIQFRKDVHEKNISEAMIKLGWHKVKDSHKNQWFWEKDNEESEDEKIVQEPAFPDITEPVLVNSGKTHFNNYEDKLKQAIKKVEGEV